jgi:hypothetical protein
MATQRNVADGSRWCRDCGGATTIGGGRATCANRAADGTQLIAQDVCENLGPERRRFCEQCRGAEPSAGRCVHCGQPTLRG